MKVTLLLRSDLNINPKSLDYLINTFKTKHTISLEYTHKYRRYIFLLHIILLYMRADDDLDDDVEAEVPVWFAGYCVR